MSKIDLGLLERDARAADPNVLDDINKLGSGIRYICISNNTPTLNHFINMSPETTLALIKALRLAERALCTSVRIDTGQGHYSQFENDRDEALRYLRAHFDGEGES